jgi:hypothetical protein
MVLTILKKKQEEEEDDDDDGFVVSTPKDWEIRAPSHRCSFCDSVM